MWRMWMWMFGRQEQVGIPGCPCGRPSKGFHKVLTTTSDKKFTTLTAEMKSKEETRAQNVQLHAAASVARVAAAVERVLLPQLPLLGHEKMFILSKHPNNGCRAGSFQNYLGTNVGSAVAATGEEKRGGLACI